MLIDIDTACNWIEDNVSYDLSRKFHEAMEKETICEKLCMDAKIGDVFKYKDKTFIVKEGTETEDCSKCIFNDTKEGCVLLTCNCVTPCGSFNNNIGKSLIFIECKNDEMDIDKIGTEIISILDSPKSAQLEQDWMSKYYIILSEQYKQFEAEHGKEIMDALAKDFGAIGTHCQQLMDKYK